jgi:hypothetical protein
MTLSPIVNLTNHPIYTQATTIQYIQPRIQLFSHSPVLLVVGEEDFGFLAVRLIYFKTLDKSMP